MKKWLQWLDHTFLFFALLCSAPLFLILMSDYFDMAVSFEHQWSSMVFAGVTFVTYFYWLFRGLVYLYCDKQRGKDKWQ